MESAPYATLRLKLDSGILFVTIDSPPINLMTLEMTQDLERLAMEVAADDAIKVVVFRSANPEYFIAHFDVTVLERLPGTPPPRPGHARGLGHAFSAMPKVSIAQIEGRARGGGSEFVLALDMRFGALGRAILAQPEIAVGILPGGGGTQRLPRTIGRARALEVILGGMDISAVDAERYGYLNRALPADELGPFVERLARRIASYSAEAIALNKQAVLCADRMDMEEGLREEAWLFGRLAATSDAKQRMAKILAAGAQTYEGELDFDALLTRAGMRGDPAGLGG